MPKSGTRSSRTSPIGSKRHGEIRRRLACLAGLISCGAVAAFAAIVTSSGGCGVSYIDLCDPSIFPNGTADKDYIALCTNCGRCDDCKLNYCDIDYIGWACLWCEQERADAGQHDAAEDTGEEDAGDAAADAPIGGCAGRCLPVPPNGWELPSLVWIGDEAEAPPCPEAAPAFGFEGHSGLIAEAACGACQCAPPHGACHLPAVLTAAADTCAARDPSTPTTPFAAPAEWDGGCTTDDAIPEDQLCAGTPCVQSLTIAPLALDEVGCEPVASVPTVPTTPATTWTAFARACRGIVPGTCETYGLGCSPADVPGFRACIYQKGDTACPAGVPYSERYVFYDGVTDTRACAPCTCGPPAGSACSAQIAIYPDGACATDPSYVETISAAGPACHDLVPGSPLGSKAATVPVYTPGACAVGGGEPVGSAVPVGPSTLCCLPSP